MLKFQDENEFRKTVNHPVKNSLNFRHPSSGGEFLLLQLGYLGYNNNGRTI
jgi:hypothetical protein